MVEVSHGCLYLKQVDEMVQLQFLIITKDNKRLEHFGNETLIYKSLSFKKFILNKKKHIHLSLVETLAFEHIDLIYSRLVSTSIES